MKWIEACPTRTLETILWKVRKPSRPHIKFQVTPSCGGCTSLRPCLNSWMTLLRATTSNFIRVPTPATSFTSTSLAPGTNLVRACDICFLSYFQRVAICLAASLKFTNEWLYAMTRGFYPYRAASFTSTILTAGASYACEPCSTLIPIPVFM